MIYLDHNATSPMLPEVLEAMRPWLGVPANPSSVHRAGQAAAVAVEQARDAVAVLVGGVPEGVVFTSGATEANHLFLRGAARRVEGPFAAARVEHPCVQAALEAVCADGGERITLPVDASGRIVLDALPERLGVLAIMAANHETGVIQDLDAARDAARARGALLHVDATQAAGRVPLALGDVDGVALSAHKLGGPGGVGALVLRNGEAFPALFAGAQERGRRGGTVNTAGAVGFAAACVAAHRELAERRVRWQAWSDRIRAALPALGARLVGAHEHLLPNTTCAIFPGLLGETLVQALDLAGICVSSGAACASGSVEPSPVLLAMGDPEPRAALRISLGPGTTEEDVEGLLRALPRVVGALRLEASFG